MSYRLEQVGVTRLSDNLHITRDMPEWDEYRVWIAAGNSPLPMDVPPVPLAAVKEAKIAEIEEAYQQAIQQPISYMGHVFQADSASQDILTKTLTSLNAVGAVPDGFAWWDISNVPVPMTLAQLNGLAFAMLARGWESFQHKQALKDAARAAQTVADVEAVAW